MDDVSKESEFGDYSAKELLAESQTTRTWLAEQVSVGRMVLIQELKPEAAGERDSFLADVRAKAAVEHPLVRSIYEASTENGRCFFAEELLPGKTLAERGAEGQTFKAQRFVHILRRISEANIYHESHDNATSPMGLGAVHVDEHGVIRIQNLAIAGGRIPDHSLRDVLKLGTDLEDLLDKNQPGATRCLTLLAWMRGQGVSKSLGWAQVRDYCEQIEQQLTEPSEVVAPPTSAIRPQKKHGLVWVVGLLVLAAVAGIFLMPKSKKVPKKKVEETTWIRIAAGKHQTPDGFRFQTADFEIAATETTIGEYAEFLESLEILAKDGGEKIYDHGDQPESKIGHAPNDWKELYDAAKISGTWEDEEVDIHHPVVGVDWWDAYAYAKWKRGFLPTQEQWLGALMSGAKVPSKIPVSEWIPVTENSEDRTTNGLFGMAGSVSEWTSEARANPANPIGNELWVIAGGSYLMPGKGATTRQFVPARDLRRPDLGFRVAREVSE